MNLASFQQSLQTFYQQPSRSLAEDLIHWWVTTPHEKHLRSKENGCPLVLYASLRLASIYPDLVRQYEKLLGLATPMGKKFLVRTLSSCADKRNIAWGMANLNEGHESIVKRSVSSKSQELTRLFPIHTFLQLDLCWMEFFLTGDPRIVLGITDRLRNPSEVRRRLNKWLSRRGPMVWLNSKRRSQAIIKMDKTLGIVCDSSGVKNREDLDCLCLQNGVIGDIQYDPCFNVARYLPFQMAFFNQASIGIKMQTKWSLFWHALDHLIVRDVCLDTLDLDDYSESKLNRSLALLDIAANVFAAEKNGHQALKLARKFIELDPCSRRMKNMVRRLEVGNELNDLLETSVWTAMDESGGYPKIKDLLDACFEQMARVKSYETVRKVTNEIRGERHRSSWHLVYEHPNRFKVNQRVESNTDSWVTLGNETYHHLNLLAQSPQPDSSQELVINQNLLMGNILHELIGMNVQVIGNSGNGCGYLVLHGTLPTSPRFLRELGATNVEKCWIEVWIHKKTDKLLELSKVAIRAGTLEFQQAFAGHDSTRVSLEEFS